MKSNEALAKAKAVLGQSAYIQDRRKWRKVEGSPLSGKCIVGITGPFANHVRGWGDTFEDALEMAKRKS